MADLYGINPYDDNQGATGGAAANGRKGSQTMTSRTNADLHAAGSKGDPYAAFGKAGAAWGAALGRRPIGMGPQGIPAAGAPRAPIAMAPQRAPQGMAPGVPAASPWQPINTPYLDWSKQSNPGLRSEGSPNPYATPMQIPGQPPPVPPGMTRVFGEPTPNGGTIQAYGTTPNQFSTPMDVPWMNEPGPGIQWNPVTDPWTPPPAPAGVPFGEGMPQGGGVPGASRFAPINNPYYERMTADGEAPFATDPSGAQPSGFNPTGPPLPASNAPTNRPPATPSTQPAPVVPRPPATPSVQPPPNPYTNPLPVQWMNEPGPAPRGPTQFSVPFPGGSPWMNEPGPVDTAPQGGGRSATGLSGPQYAPNGQLLGTGGAGRRLAAPDDPTSASGQRSAAYQWFTKPDGTKEFWQVDQNGQPVARASSGMNGPTGNQTAIPWGQTAPGQPAGSTATTTTTGGGQFGAPNNTTAFDPNILPSSNVGDWLDPVQQDAMDRIARQLRHEGSLTGATNSGGFIPGMTEALAPVANQFAAQKGQLMYQDQQAKADRLLDQYKFDNTLQLQQWIETNKNELERYGIDQNVLLGRYNADAGVKSAGIGASASANAARYGADASRYNAELDYRQGMAGIGANYGLGQDRLGYDYYNANQNYDLGKNQIGYNYWNSGQQRQYDDMFNQRGYDLGVYGVNRDVYGMDQAQQRYLMDLMWRMSPGGQMGGGYFPSPGVFPYGG